MSESPEELHEVVIDDLAYGGDGVGHLPEGLAVFVPFTIPGEKVRIRIVERKRSYARAELVELLSKSPDRVSARCPYYGVCGGCQYQHLTDKAELRWKVHQLEESLRRIGGLEQLPAVEPVVASPRSYGYRNKIVLHPTREQGAPPYGYHTVDGQHILPIETCPIADPVLQKAVGELTASDQRGVPLTLRRAENDRVFRYYGSGPREAPWLREHLLGQRLNVPLTAFAQINDGVADAVVEWLAKQVEAKPPRTVLDLYCGAGLFALALGKKAKQLIAVERDRESVRAARFNAGQWGLQNATITCAPVERALPEILRGIKSPDQCVVILDPPRGGCEKEVIHALGDWQPERIIYVSCNPTSLARDLKRLNSRNAYTIAKLALFDMFPQTAHFESVVILERS